MSGKEWMERADKALMTTYARTPVVFVKGEGARLWDVEGKEYLDFVAGIAVCNLGHAHPAVAEAVGRQAEKLVHVSNLYYTQPMIELAERLTAASFADRVFFCNSGAEANEGAIKLARRYFDHNDQPERYKIITVQGSFHGRTMAALTATGQDKIKAGFDPLVPGFTHVPYNDLAVMAAAVDDETAAIMIEPVLGEGGVVFPDEGYLKGVRKLCDEKGLLLIYDEIQTGLGRTGHLFAHQREGALPDIMTLAKGLANGLPMGALLATERVAAAFTPGSHATTFGGTPLVAAAANAVWDELARSGFLDRVQETGRYFLERLDGLVESHDSALEARGRGLMLALALNKPAAGVVKELLERGFVVNSTQDTILRFVPPLIIDPEMIDRLIEALDELLKELD